MKKTVSFIISVLLIPCPAVQAKSLSSELVDLHKNHWAYNATTKLIDKYSLIQGFPDHTFRGEKGVNRYELSVITGNVIKYLEEKRKISLKTNESIPEDYKNKSLGDIPKNNWARPAVVSLKDNYNLILSPPYENTFGGNKNITRQELAFTLDKLISLLKQDLMDKNPYEVPSAAPAIQKAEVPAKKITPESWAEQSIKNMINYKIMIGFSEKNDFKPLEEVNRYQLAIALVKTLDYIESIKVN
jgi:hypothetical protein